MADNSTTANMAAQTPIQRDRHIFRLMDLPAELRELIYYYASAPFPPIDTASIRNTPDAISFPAVAQLSRQTRNEALAVFYRNREVHLSLHCDRNVERSIAWLSHWGDDTQLTDKIVLEGLHKRGTPGSMFHLTITCLRKEKETQYRVNMRSHQDPKAEKACQAVKESVSLYIDKKVASDLSLLDEVGKLTKSEMLDIFTLVRSLTGWDAAWLRVPPPLDPRPSHPVGRRRRIAR